MAGEKLSKCVVPGSKVDIRVENTKKHTKDEGMPYKDYRSQVYDVISDDQVEVVMPMEKFGMVLLPVGEEYDLFFNSKNGLYQCRARVVERIKKETLYVLVMDITTNLKREQRREYYRFSCSLPIETRLLDKNELTNMENRGWKNVELTPELPTKLDTTLDIGGGGLRFVSEDAYEDGDILLCIYQLETDKGLRTYQLPGKILSVRRGLIRTDLFEHRIKYLSITNDERDDIMKYIFKEERKRRR